MWFLVAGVLAAACFLLALEILRIRSDLNCLADCAAAWCEADHG